jgi:hypothetical protein
VDRHVNPLLPGWENSGIYFLVDRDNYYFSNLVVELNVY